MAALTLLAVVALVAWPERHLSFACWRASPGFDWLALLRESSPKAGPYYHRGFVSRPLTRAEAPAWAQGELGEDDGTLWREVFVRDDSLAVLLGR